MVCEGRTEQGINDKSAKYRSYSTERDNTEKNIVLPCIHVTLYTWGYGGVGI